VTVGAVGGSVARNQQASVPVRSRSLVVALALSTVLFALLLLLGPRATGAGPEMDEGAVLAYSSQVLEGAIPHRDFLTFYGPGNLWLVAGAFEVFGSSITTERGVGLFYRLALVLSLFALARRLGGPAAAVLAGIIAVTVMADDVIWAAAVYGALAFGLIGLALLSYGVSAPGRGQQLLLMGGGAAAGVAALMRFDTVPALVVSALPLLALVSVRGRLWYASGFVACAGLYVPHLVVVGPAKIERTLSDLLANVPGRRLPLPRPSEFPGSMLAYAVVVTGMLVLGGAIWSLRDRRTLEGRVLLAIGLFNLGLLPWTLSRADEFHIKPTAIIPLSLLPAVALLVLRSARIRSSVRIAWTAVVAVTVVVILAALGGIKFERTHPSVAVENSGRSFFLDDRARAASVTKVVAEAEKRSKTGDSLFVGPLDLRRTNLGATYIYFLMPKLEPASYYMEMNPHTANREGSGFAAELRRADWLILTSEWDDWREPNDSRDVGPSEPNEVVRRMFCPRFESGEYRLYERCARS
jgi:hypothetical protein